MEDSMCVRVFVFFTQSNFLFSNPNKREAAYSTHKQIVISFFQYLAVFCMCVSL